jgi:polyisoprenoid-binding protein YceI
MNRTFSFALSFIAVAVLAASSVFAQTQWNLDRSHSSIKFSVKHLLVSEAEGKFKSFSGTVSSKDDSFEDMQISFAIDVASIDSDDEKRDSHLKGDDFFAADKFPQIKFVGKSIQKVGKGKFKLMGDLTMRDVTKSVVWDVDFNGIVKDPYGNTKAGFKAITTVNRLEYGLKWNAMIEGGSVVDKDVKITANIELAKPKA